MEGKDITFYPRRFMARIIFGFLSFFLFYFALTNNLVHQWRSPPLILPMADNVYWLLHILYIPQFIIRDPIAAWMFDLLFVGSTVASFIFPQKTACIALSIACFWIFQICYSTSAGNHYHHLGYLL